MKTFLAKDVKADCQKQLNSTTEWTDADFSTFINMAIRKVMRDVPASRFTSPVAFTDEALFTMTGSSGTAIADTDAIALDVRWRDLVTQYVLYLCFNQPDRSTTNKTFADEALRRYEELL